MPDHGEVLSETSSPIFQMDIHRIIIQLNIQPPQRLVRHLDAQRERERDADAGHYGALPGTLRDCAGSEFQRPLAGDREQLRAWSLGVQFLF